MAKLHFPPGTILRFRGTDGKDVHMGFVIDETHVMELIEQKQKGEQNGICNICVTDINRPHPLTGDASYDRWCHPDYKPSGWSLQQNSKQIESAYEEFHCSTYNKIHNNCQHFAYRAVTGYRRSPDVEKIPSILVDLGIAEMFAGASEASSDASSTALIQQYVQDGQLLIQLLRNYGSTESTSEVLQGFSGVVTSVEALRKFMGGHLGI